MTLTATAQAKIHTQNFEYKEGEAILEGYLAYDDAFKGDRPGVLLVPEWKGIGAHVKERAEKLAALGYIAFAADIYGKGIRPTTPEEAGKIAGLYKNDRPLLRKRVNAGLEALKKQKHVNVQKLAAMGYCFGGTSVLELARSGADVLAVMSFHGGLGTPTPQDIKNFKGRIIAFHGADDPFVPAEEVNGFEKEMKDSKMDWELIKFGGAVHSFTNKEAGNDNSKGAAYNEKADLRSWEIMKRIFDDIFKK